MKKILSESLRAAANTALAASICKFQAGLFKGGRLR
jgi:hypothetical protein